MRRSQRIVTARNIFSSIFMVVTLLWLTVSTPFVYQAQQIQKETRKQSKQTDNTNPFSNTTEEKNESNASTLSEYLHEHLSTETQFVILVREYKRYPSIIYPEHYPELLSPPPEA